MSSGTGTGSSPANISTSTLIQPTPIVQDQSAYVYHEIKPHMEPYLPTIIEEEPVKPLTMSVHAQKEVLAQVSAQVSVQQPHKKKKQRK